MPFETGFRVDAKDNKPGFQKPDQPKESGSEAVSPAEEERKKTVEAYRAHAQAFLDARLRSGFLSSYAKDASLSYKLSNAFFIDLEKGEINLDTSWFFDRDMSEEQILWAILHENGHFIDMKENPDGMKAEFDRIRAEGRKTGADIGAKWRDALDLDGNPEHKAFYDRMTEEHPIDPKRPEKGTASELDNIGYGIHHLFANILDDINDNFMVARLAPAYDRGSAGHGEVTRLYREKLFPGTDYQENSRHRQFAYALIREVMVDDESVTVSDEVEEALSREIRFRGKVYTARDIVREFVMPKRGRDTKATERKLVIRYTLEPLFKELLKKDLDEWKPVPPEKQERDSDPQEGDPQSPPGGSPDPFQKENKKHTKNNIDQFDPKQMEAFREHAKQKKESDAKNGEARKQAENVTPEERNQQAQAAQDEKWAAKNADENHTPEKLLANLKLFREREREVEPYLAELSALWRNIIGGRSREIGYERDGFYKTGELSVSEAIRQWPVIVGGNLEQIRVMERTTAKERLVEKPELIRVRLVADMSDSMDNTKIEMLQKTVTLLLSSLYEFNRYLDMTRARTKSKLRVDTEVYVFGDDAEKVKSFESGQGGSCRDATADNVLVFEHLQSTRGWTYDNNALEQIVGSLHPDDVKKMKEGKIMDLVFEITDGGSSDERAAKNAVARLLENGIIARAFQIGIVSAKETKTFDAVWNAGEERFGEAIGADLEKLLPAMVGLLKKYFSGVRL